MKLPEDAPAPINDPMIQMHFGKERLDIPAPRAVFRDVFSLDKCPPPEVAGSLFTKTNLAQTEEGNKKREEIYGSRPISTSGSVNWTDTRSPWAATS